MENASLPSDVWNDVTTSSSKDDDLVVSVPGVRVVTVKAPYIIVGTVGVIDNLFVIVVFVFFVKITDKVTLWLLLRFHSIVLHNYYNCHFHRP